MESPLKNEMLEEYRSALREYGAEDFRSLLWGSKEGASARLRYEAMERHAGGFQDRSVLELGCGFGGLFAFGLNCGRYLGLDLVDEYLVEAQRRFGADGREFRKGDIDDNASWAAKDAFDLVILSGATAHRGGPAWHPAQLRALLQAMHTTALSKVLINFPSVFADIRTEGVEYFAPSFVLDIAQAITPFVIVDNSYLRSDFLLVMGKK